MHPQVTGRCPFRTDMEGFARPAPWSIVSVTGSSELILIVCKALAMFACKKLTITELPREHYVIHAFTSAMR